MSVRDELIDAILARCPVPVDPAQEAADALKALCWLDRSADEREAALWTFLRYVFPYPVQFAAAGEDGGVVSRLRDVCDRAGVTIPRDDQWERRQAEPPK